MPDLHTLARPLIEHPPWPPPPIEVLRRRAGRRRRRRQAYALAGVASIGLVAAGAVAVWQDEPGQQVISTGPSAPATIPADTPALEEFHPVAPVTVIDEGVAEGTPWQLVAFRGSLSNVVDVPEDPGAAPVEGLTKSVTCHLLLDPRSEAERPAGGGGCTFPDEEPVDGAGGHGFSYFDGVTFVLGKAGRDVATVQIELRDGRRVEVTTRAVEGDPARYWVAPLPGRGEGDGWLERANAAVVAIRRLDIRGGELESSDLGRLERDGGG